MSIRPTAAERGAELPVAKLLALGVWLISVATTYAVIVVLLGPGAPWYIALVTALVVQMMLTAAEWRMFVDGRRNEVGVIALVADVAVNAGGLYGPMTRIGETSVGAMLSSISGAAPSVGPIAAGVLAALAGYVLARAPEYIWRGE